MILLYQTIQLIKTLSSIWKRLLLNTYRSLLIISKTRHSIVISENIDHHRDYRT